MLTPDALRQRATDLRLVTPRLTLRRFAARDLDTARAHELDRRIMGQIRDPEPAEALDARIRALIEPWQADEGEWLGLVIALDDAMIGLAAFRVVSHANQTVEIGYRLALEHQRRGYALEACRALLAFLIGTLEVRKVVAFCVVDNQPSARLLEKLGMRCEGRLREFSMLGGRWQDEFAYGLLAREWGR